jgi:hypothetical protein
MTSLRGNMPDRKNLMYIVTGTNLANDLVTYSTSFSSSTGQTTGSFAAHPNAASVVAGFILLDLGNRLVPGQKPNVPTLMVNVSVLPYDLNGRRIGSFPAVNGVTQVGITAYIDPNSPNVAIYSRDRPIDMNDNLYFSGAANLNLAGAQVTNAYLQGNPGNTVDLTAVGSGNGVRHRGPSVYTGGLLTAAGGASVSGGLTVATGGVTATIGQIRSATATVITPSGTPNIDATLGQVFTFAQATGATAILSSSASPPIGSLVYLVVTPAGTGAAITGGTNVKMAAITPTTGKTTTIAFVSDGTNLNQFSSATSA